MILIVGYRVVPHYCPLVGGWPTPLKNDGVQVTWDDFPTVSGKSLKIPWFQSPPTRLYTIFPYNYGKSPFFCGKINILNGPTIEKPPYFPRKLLRKSGPWQLIILSTADCSIKSPSFIDLQYLFGSIDINSNIIDRYWLVVEPPTPLKNHGVSSSVGMIFHSQLFLEKRIMKFPTEWKNQIQWWNSQLFLESYKIHVPNHQADKNLRVPSYPCLDPHRMV